MKPRFLILLILAAGLAIYLATRASAPPTETPLTDVGADPPHLERIRGEQKMLSEYDLPGVEPPTPPQFDVRVEVDPAGDKNRLYFYITEAHGYYVETFNIDFYYKPTPDTSIEDSPLVVPVFLNDYLKANETYKGCTDVVWAELKDVGGEMGTTENWAAEIVSYNRARVHNPRQFRPISKTGKCR